MDVYEFNQMGYHSLPKMSKARVEANMANLETWMRTSEFRHYWLLLNNETHYYTFFVWDTTTSRKFAAELLSLVKELGTLKSIEPNSTNDAYEFWITGHDGTTRMYLFFNYDRGVIEL